MTLVQTDNIIHIHLEETESTNSVAKAAQMPPSPIMLVVSADYQTQGRGQRGNSWESERGKNLSFSVLFHPENIKASHQFIISEAISLSICDALSLKGVEARIKWPNDIYVGDRKICGILIENVLAGKFIDRCVIGVGLNINQQEFLSNAPNPVSLRQILGKDTSREAVLVDIIRIFSERIKAISLGGAEEADSLYRQSLYRGDGMYTYEDETGRFQASIEEVEPDGHLILRDLDGNRRRYAFKEVKSIIGPKGLVLL